MLLGTRDKFDYLKCGECGCLQIGTYPSDLSKYYPANYYSFSPFDRGRNEVRKLLAKARNRHLMTGQGLLGRILAKAKPTDAYQMLRRVALHRDLKILDVGCGAGHLVHAMYEAGFTNVTGADPFLAGDADPGKGPRFIKSELSHIAGSFGLIMLNHSLEHMPDQQKQLIHIERLLDKNGVCIIRIPLCSSEAWNRYGTDWVQLDAPRHFYLHTVKSFGLLAGRAGMSITDMYYDSHSFQFWGSELYRRGISLAEAEKMVPPPFDSDAHRKFSLEARQLNQRRLGDQAVFYLRKSDQP